MIGRYSGAQPEEAPLHKLGSGQWDKAKARAAAKQVRDTAAELLALYAKRAARLGHSFSIKQHDLEAFADGFGFEETPDQGRRSTRCSPTWRPASRWTAWSRRRRLRQDRGGAARRLRRGGRRLQVVMLCPTTLLAEQHFQTFSDRFADWPVKIAEPSRFDRKQSRRWSGNWRAARSTDIVIGTHKLLARG